MTVHTAQTSAAARVGAPGGLPRIEDAGQMAPQDARALSKVFFGRLRGLDEGTTEHQYARNTLIEMNLSLVRFAAGRFRSRGSGDMDLAGQIEAVDGLDEADGADLDDVLEFTSFAVPYIVGEIKRYLRDTTWSVHVPRRLQELRVDLAKAKEKLAAGLDRDPTVRELADHLGLTEAEITEGIVAANGYTAGSLDTPSDAADPAGRATGARTYAEVLGAPDPAMEAVENLQTLAPLLDELDARERRTIDLRFGVEMTQAQIGEELGISQMHVSRLLGRTLGKLRTGMLTQD
ncbi:sigma-70 family RNA polymerase sigma factor [Streptomyces sp. NPDC057428]|uniref:sigma-70 family RNA polymerase sigma factor n=1 Tax=Streptomyces sp. NPDC057428 TaxID=3346129 RepID=UPI00367D5C25